MRNTSVPTTFPEMFTFNAAVMGFGNNTWMQEVLNSFDAIVTNASNSYRLQESEHQSRGCSKRGRKVFSAGI